MLTKNRAGVIIELNKEQTIKGDRNEKNNQSFHNGYFSMLVYLFFNYGGLSFIAQNVPDNHLSFTGGRPITYILVWYFIALGTLVDPAFYQFELI